MHKKGEDKVVIIHVNEMTRSIGKLIIIVLLTWDKQEEVTVMTFMINTVLTSLEKNPSITFWTDDFAIVLHAVQATELSSHLSNWV